MPNYMLVYKGEATDMAEMSPEDGAAVMQKWNEWMDKVGSSLEDVGSPFGAGTSVVDDGSTADAAKLTGYSIVSAENLEAAQALTQGHPYLSDGAGNYSIEVYELMPVPFDA